MSDYKYKNKNINFTIDCYGSFKDIKTGQDGCYMVGYDTEFDEEIEESLDIPESVNTWKQLCEYVVKEICVDGIEIEEISAC